MPSHLTGEGGNLLGKWLRSKLIPFEKSKIVKNEKQSTLGTSLLRWKIPITLIKTLIGQNESQKLQHPHKHEDALGEKIKQK